MKYLLHLLVSFIALGQGASLGITGCPSSAIAGSTITCSITLSGGNTTATGPADIQASITTSWNNGANNIGIAGVGSTQAKSIGFNTSTQIVIVYGINNNLLPDGIVANISFIIPNNVAGNQTLSLSNIIGATASAANFPIAASPIATVSISPSINFCDVDKNGTVNAQDVAAELQLILTKVNGDRNGDGVTNVVDLRIIENAVLGMGCIATQ